MAQLIRLGDKGADTVAIVATLEAVGILRDARALNYHPKWTGFGWAFDFVTKARVQGSLPPITWGRGDYVGTLSSFPAQCCGANNTWARLGPAAERF